MILPIYVYGQPVLRKEAEELTPDYPELKKLVEDMYETMHASEGVGLAAPQVGLAIRLVVIDADPLKDTYPELKGVTLTLVNPELDIITDGKKITRQYVWQIIQQQGKLIHKKSFFVLFLIFIFLI